MTISLDVLAPHTAAWAGALGALAVLALTPLAAPAALRLGWVDAPAGPDAHRKRQPAPVPAVGGAVLLAGVAVALALGSPAAAPQPSWLSASLRAQAPGPALLVPLGLAFALGLADDVRARGLPWWLKLAGQTLAGLALAWALGCAGAAFAAFALAAVAAQNACNTFDNTDGAATGLGVLALAAPAPGLALCALAFLPFNLARAGRAGPRAYLGDSGSHVLGVLCAAHPAAWPALLLPLADLARLAVVRWRAGQAPWVGDRRHLAHRLAASGLGERRALLVLCACAAPAPLGAALGMPLAGACATLAAFGAALAWTAAPGQQGPADAEQKGPADPGQEGSADPGASARPR